MDTYFPGDSYRTDPAAPRGLRDKICLGTRWGLYLGVFGAVLEASSAAKKGIYDDEFWARSSYRIFHDIELSGGRFDITGFDNIRKSRDPVVFISNHISALETVVFPVLIVPIKKVTFVVKEKLVKGPFFGPIMKSRNPIAVSRKDPRSDLKTVLTRGKKLLEDGYSIIVFPQHTRTHEFNPERFNTLGIKLALRAGVNVIPVAIKTDFWQNGRILRGFGPLKRNLTIHFRFGKEMQISGRGRDEHAAIIDFIQQNLETWKRCS